MAGRGVAADSSARPDENRARRGDDSPPIELDYIEGIETPERKANPEPLIRLGPAENVRGVQMVAQIEVMEEQIEYMVEDLNIGAPVVNMEPEEDQPGVMVEEMNAGGPVVNIEPEEDQPGVMVEEQLNAGAPVVNMDAEEDQPGVEEVGDDQPGPAGAEGIPPPPPGRMSYEDIRRRVLAGPPNPAPDISQILRDLLMGQGGDDGQVYRRVAAMEQFLAMGREALEHFGQGVSALRTAADNFREAWVVMDEGVVRRPPRDDPPDQSEL